MKGRHFRSLSKEKVKSKFQEFKMSAAELQYVPPIFDSSHSIAFSALSLCDSCYDFFDYDLCQISSKIPCTVLRWESIMIQGVRIVVTLLILYLLYSNSYYYFHPSPVQLLPRMMSFVTYKDAALWCYLSLASEERFIRKRYCTCIT